MGTRAHHAALLVCALAGCGGAPTGPMQNPGVLTMTVAPPAISVQSLALTTATVPLLTFTVVANSGQPDARSMLAEVDFAPGMMAELSFSMLPQGLYSAISFIRGGGAFEGTWRGMPLHIMLEREDHPVPIVVRAPTGAEIDPGVNGALTVTADTNSWFANNILDGATPVAGAITIADNSNEIVGEQLAQRIASSFTLQ
jgi:hypothetical protein